ncbi:VOC family protein [Nocardioides sp.]|uniref:VOC family protein n=1 Tax=Nocardioides sp. TaxID=35761 RepID=UPI002736E2E5|nr:VOC family protein [Nocardioides sp.]MDP3890420.1 VOC family protein [Nocardioides sp.]
MSHDIQIAVDCHDPHTLADWWAETLEWSVEPTDEAFIRRMIAEGHAGEDDTIEHRGRLVWRDGAAICPPDQVDSPQRQRILFQPVPEPKQGKNRVHWDVRLDGQDKDVVRDRLVERGASYLTTGRQGPHSWHVMTDPEGNEFCIG